MIVIGDSHALTFELIEGVRIIHLGDVSAWKSLDYADTISRCLEPFPGEPILVSMGEIDCRVLIHDAMVRTRESLVYTIWLAQYRMFETFKRYENLSYLAVIPAGYQDNYYQVSHYSDRIQRQAITDAWNRDLRRFIGELRCVDPWGAIEFDEGGLAQTKQYQDDAVHLRPEVVLDCWQKGGFDLESRLQV